MRKLMPIVALLAIAPSLGCSSGGGSSGGTTAQVQGKWSATSTSTKFPGISGTLDANIHQTGTSISAPQLETILISPPCSNGNESLIGTVSGNTVTITLLEGGQQVHLTGTVSADGQSIGGSYTADAGGCLNGDGGTWSARKFSPATGVYTGTIDSVPPHAVPIGSQVGLTEGVSFDVTGSATFTNWTCFGSVTFTQGVSIGSLFVVITGNTSPQLILGGQFEEPVATHADVFAFVSGGACDGEEDDGVVTRTGSIAGQTAQPARPISLGANPAIRSLIERMRKLAAER
jgi:hypothetical protein